MLFLGVCALSGRRGRFGSPCLSFPDDGYLGYNWQTPIGPGVIITIHYVNDVVTDFFLFENIPVYCTSANIGEPALFWILNPALEKLLSLLY